LAAPAADLAIQQSSATIVALFSGHRRVIPEHTERKPLLLRPYGLFIRCSNLPLQRQDTPKLSAIRLPHDRAVLVPFSTSGRTHRPATTFASSTIFSLGRAHRKSSAERNPAVHFLEAKKRE
jgi:hypothetical protein